jgi:hypothetical protein
MFLSHAFYDDAVMGGQVKSPVQLAVQLTHDLNIDPMPAHTMSEATARLGQRLFYPPNVKGWDGNSAWVNANAMLLRVNLPATLVSAGPREARMHERAMQTMTGAMAPGMTDEGSDEAMMAEEPTEQAPGMTADQRQALRRQMREAGTPEERRAIYRAARRGMAQGPAWNARAMFDGIEDFQTYGAAVDRLAVRFLAVPLSAEQRSLIAQALGASEGPGQSVTLDAIPPDHLLATLHLLLSTAEYQLC